MFNQSIKNIMERKKFITALPQTNVQQASKLMTKANVGAVLVVEEERLLGILSERDVVFRVVAKGLDPRVTLLSEVMTKEPITLSPTKSYGQALLLMQENGFRHIPVVDNGRPVGIVSSRNAMDPELEEFVFEARRREHLRQL